MNDLNKTPLTHDVTSAVAFWMDEKGFKPVETEVPMPWVKENDKGWIADLAGVIVPTQTELINLKLLTRAPKYYLSNGYFGNPDEEYKPNPAYEKWSEERFIKQRLMTCLVEVKTSRGDFVGDRKWNLDVPSDLAYLAVPKGLISPDEWPVGWGILEFSENAIRQKRPSFQFTATVEHQRDIILAIAIRRDHNTRYARLREHEREDRQRRNLERINYSIRDIHRAIIDITKGKHESVENVLRYQGIRNVNPWVIKELEQLWGIAKEFKDCA